MSGFTFTPAENADPAALAEAQAALARLKPSCSRCGRNLTKRELDARRCADLDECRIRQAFGGNAGAGVTDYRRLRKHIAAHGSPFIQHGGMSRRETMLDPRWTPERGYSHAENLLAAFARSFA